MATQSGRYRREAEHSGGEAPTFFGISEFRLTKPNFWIMDVPSRSFQRGRIAIVTDAERDAVDAKAAR
jgi:hypothetical protein